MADYFSRKPIGHNDAVGTPKQSFLADEFVNFVTAAAAPRAIGIGKLIEATRKDQLLHNLTKIIRSGQKNKSKELEPFLANSH